jgi:predicted AlkP superfamily phosphohydrolase/phosphomutase/tetratricopeptide (TPR) repeat protein
VAIVAWIGLGVRSIPDGAVGLLDSLVRGDRTVGPGLRFTLPGLESLEVLDPYRRAGTLVYRTPEGAQIDMAVDLGVRLTREGADELIERVDTGSARERLDAAVDTILVDLFRSSAKDHSLPHLGPSLDDAIVAVLSGYGDVEGDLRIDFAEDSPVTAAVREAELRRRVREQRHDTETKILIIGLDGADWQIADPLIERGLLPNLASLRERGAWGNIKALNPILSPLIWTSIATGVTPDRHGVLDFLIRDPATGQHVPVSSRFRRVRALWNLFSDAGLSSDIVAWWATWPSEPIEGHMVSDRVAYSLFDFELPTGGVGATYPEAYFDEIRPLMIEDDAIAYEDVSRFVKITPDEFREIRARIEVDRKSAYKHPVNHLTKILASTQNYHRIALDLLGRGQADLTAVYYQAIDEIGHRFMHYMPPPLESADPDLVRRYGGAVEAMYVVQDELIGELLEAVDPETTVIVISDHGFLNGADRPKNETADIEGTPGRWHRQYGVLILAGPEIVSQKLDTTSMLDIAPTVLWLAGLPVPDDTDGRVLTEAVRPGFAERFPETRVATYEVAPFHVAAAERTAEVAAAEAEIVENLRSLGYISGSDTAGDVPTGGAAAGAISAATGTETLTGLTNLAAVLMSEGEYDAAEKEVLRALELEPGYRVALQQLFSVRMAQERFDEAIEIGETVLDDIEPDNVTMTGRVASAYLRADRLEEGLESFTRRIDNGQWYLGASLSRLLSDTGDLDAADRVARAVLAKDPDNPEAMAIAFRVAQVRGDLTGLAPMLREAIERNPRSVMHLNWLAIAYESVGEMDRAETLLLRALDANPDHGGSMANLGAFYGRHGRQGEAITLLERALRIDPGNVDARVNLGSAFARSGRYPEAAAEFELAYEHGRQTTEICNAAAAARAQGGDLSSAAEWIRRSLDLDPDQPKIRRTLAQIEAGNP